MFDFSPEELMSAALLMFEDLGVLAECHVPRPVAEQFVLAIRQRYRDANSFHNFYHAVSVLHFTYYALIHSGAMTFLSKLDVAGLLVASFCHDVAHPGNTNTFELNSRSALAMRYNDQSILENYHTFVTFQVLRDPRCDLFAQLPADDVRSMRKMIIHAILATDMAEHFSMCKKLDMLLASALPAASSAVAASPVATPVSDASPAPPTAAAADPKEQQMALWNASIESALMVRLPESRASLFDVSKADDRQLVCATLIHAADLSGQVYKSVQLAQEWERRISLEFQAQAAKETELGLPVAPFMTNLDDIAHRARLQVSFIDFVLSPLWKAVARSFPPLRPCLENMLKNRREYELMAQRIEVARAAAASAAISSAAASVDAGVNLDVNVDSDDDSDDGAADEASDSDAEAPTGAVQSASATESRAANAKPTIHVSESPLGGSRGFSGGQSDDEDQ